METLIVDNKVLYEIFYQAGFLHMKNISLTILVILISALLIYAIFDKYVMSIIVHKIPVNRKYISMIFTAVLLLFAIKIGMNKINDSKYTNSYKYLIESYNATKYDNILQRKYGDFKVISTTDSTFIMKK